jgi:uncharacterized protein YecT (DUF1311 family)
MFKAMRIILTFLLCLISFAGQSQTQAEMNQEARLSYRKTDKELNDLYQRILVEYQADTIFIRNLKASQRIWITFRDAELKVKYPEREPGYYGSIHPVCIANYLEQLTRERIKALEIWGEGLEEGDACNGSVRTKD